MDYKPGYKYVPPLNWHWLTPMYDVLCNLFFGLGRHFKRKVLRTLPFKDGDTIIDIGCGTGVLLQLVKQQHPNVRCIGTDPDEQSLAIAQRKFARRNLKIEICKGFAEVLPFVDASVDICVSTLALHHMPNEVKKKAIQEMYRVLKPGGVVVIADFQKGSGVVFILLHLFEKVEYLEGNLQGLVKQYVKDTGFTEPVVMGYQFPGIEIIKAKK